MFSSRFLIPLMGSLQVRVLRSPVSYIDTATPSKDLIRTNANLPYAIFLAVTVTYFFIPKIKPYRTKAIPPWRPTSLFALLIGIDKYADPANNLNGAVADAEDVKRYLEKSLGTNVCRIRTLYDKKATRENILRCLNSLIDDKLIRKGDPIVIFYAGHGSHSKAPAGWKTENGMIQLLVPHDFDERVDNGVAMISDREISVLLERIAAAKGNNIIVIFDCCHSGSITRRGNRRARFIRTQKPISKLVDPKILWSNSQLDATTRFSFLTKGLRSHVLLAACRATQSAWENGERRGRFTKALIEALEGAGTQAVSYYELIQRIDLVDQHPQCEGYHQHRIWLDPEARIQRPSSYPVLEDGGSYTMQAEAADGIMEGEQFDVYKDEKWVAEVTTSYIQAYSTTVDVISRKAWSGDGLAVKIRAGNRADLNLHIVTKQPSIRRPFAETDERLDCVHEGLRKTSRTRSLQRIVVVDEREQAELSISVKDNQIIVNIVDPLVTVHGLRQMFKPIQPNAEHVSQVLQAAAHYYRYFRRLHNDDPTGLLKTKKIKIEFKHLVEGSAKTYGKQHLKPIGKHLITKGVANLHNDEGAKYGTTITNGSNIPLYASVFFFETSTFAIDSIYEPPTAAGRNVDPLAPNGTLTIGYGSSGASPIEFELKEGQKFDVGFFKFFFSDAYVNLSAVKQDSPFDRLDPGPEPGKPRMLKRKADTNTSEGIWFTHLVPVVLRRRASAVTG